MINEGNCEIRLLTTAGVQAEVGTRKLNLGIAGAD